MIMPYDVVVPLWSGIGVRPEMTTTEIRAYNKLRQPFFYSHSKHGPIGRIDGNPCRYTTRCVAQERADQALRAARTIAQFRQWDDEFVRIQVEADDFPDTSWMDAKQREEWDGESWTTLSEYRHPFTGEWVEVDSCGGHIGYRDPSDPFENAYVVDEMRAAIDAYVEVCADLGLEPGNHEYPED